MEKINDSDSHRKATQSIHEQDDRESRNIILNLDNESFFHPMPMEEQSEPEMNSSSMVALDQEITGSAALHSLPDSSPMMIQDSLKDVPKNQMISFAKSEARLVNQLTEPNTNLADHLNMG